MCYQAVGRLLYAHCLVEDMVREWLQSFPAPRAAAFIPSLGTESGRHSLKLLAHVTTRIHVLQIPSVKVLYVVDFDRCCIVNV